MSAEKVSTVTLVDEMRDGIATLAGPRKWGDTRQSWLARGARNAGVSYRAAKALFYREWDDPRSSIVDAVRTALAKINQVQEASERDELEQMRERISILESRLATIDAEFFGDAIAAIRQAAPRNRRATD